MEKQENPNQESEFQHPDFETWVSMDGTNFDELSAEEQEKLKRMYQILQASPPQEVKKPAWMQARSF